MFVHKENPQSIHSDLEIKPLIGQTRKVGVASAFSTNANTSRHFTIKRIWGLTCGTDAGLYVHRIEYTPTRMIRSESSTAI